MVQEVLYTCINAFNDDKQSILIICRCMAADVDKKEEESRHLKEINDLERTKMRDEHENRQKIESLLRTKQEEEQKAAIKERNQEVEAKRQQQQIDSEREAQLLKHEEVLHKEEQRAAQLENEQKESERKFDQDLRKHEQEEKLRMEREFYTRAVVQVQTPRGRRITMANNATPDLTERLNLVPGTGQRAITYPADDAEDPTEGKSWMKRGKN